MTKQSVGSSTGIQLADSDYGTWSSASSGQYSEFGSALSHFDTSLNNASDLSCYVCCSRATTATTNTNHNENTSPKKGFQRALKRRWRGIRMGITIDYNIIKSYGERYRKQLSTATETDADSDGNKYLSLYDTSVEPTNEALPKQVAINDYSTDSIWMPNSSSLFSTVEDTPETELEYPGSDISKNSFHLSPTPLSYAKNTLHPNVESSPNIPQEFINNAKILTCKIAIVGGRKTGKSTLAKRQILNEVFFGESEDEVEPIFQRKNDRSNEGIVSRFMIEILENDNSEQDILRADAIMLVYSITDKNSFAEVDGYYRSIISAKKHTFPIVLVGTKTDVDKKRKVTAFEGQSLARRFNCPFIEVSAKTNEQVHQAFVELMRLVDKQYARVRRFNRSLAPLLI